MFCVLAHKSNELTDTELRHMYTAHNSFSDEVFGDGALLPGCMVIVVVV